MEMYGYQFIRESDLAHHGIKGQKWGVRRFQTASGSLTSEGKRRYSRMFSNKDTYERIKSIRKSDRYDNMSRRQKASLDKAEAYWKARAEGKKPTEKRGIIKRQSDRYRSYSTKARIGQQAAAQTLSALSTTRIRSGLYGPTKTHGQNATSVVLNTASTVLVDEILNKAFGHF